MQTMFSKVYFLKAYFQQRILKNIFLAADFQKTYCLKLKEEILLSKKDLLFTPIGNSTFGAYDGKWCCGGSNCTGGCTRWKEGHKEGDRTDFCAEWSPAICTTGVALNLDQSCEVGCTKKHEILNFLVAGSQNVLFYQTKLLQKKLRYFSSKIVEFQKIIREKYPTGGNLSVCTLLAPLAVLL